MAEGGEGVEVNPQYPWIYTPPEWDPVAVKQEHAKILAEEALAELDFADDYSARVLKFFHATKEQNQHRVREGGPASEIKVYFKKDKSTILLPSFVAEVAPVTKVGEPLGRQISPIPGTAVRYACISPYQPEADLTIVLLSVWIKPPEGYISPETQAEIDMHKNYDLRRFERNEEWELSSLYLGMKNPRDALMLVNAVSKVVYECNSKEVERVNCIRLVLTGYIEVTECTIRQRDAIDLERLAMEPSDGEDSYDEEVTDSDIEGGSVRLLPDAMNDPKQSGWNSVYPQTETEKLLSPARYYLMIDEEQFGLYKHPFCEQPFIDLRFFQNDTPVSISVMYICKRTGQLELQRGDIELHGVRKTEYEEGAEIPEQVEIGNNVFICKEDKEVPETFQKIKKLIKEKKLKAKPKNVYVDISYYKGYQESLRIKLEPLSEEDQKFQKELLDRLNEQKRAYEESKEKRRKNKTSHLPPGLEDLPPPPDPPKKRNWIRFVLTGSHQRDMPDLSLGEKWMDQIQPELAGLNINGIEPATIEAKGREEKEAQGTTETDVEVLNRTIGEIREDLRIGKPKRAVSIWKAAKLKFGDGMLSAVMKMNDMDMLERIFFLPD